jgi:hypothetical protein
MLDATSNGKPPARNLGRAAINAAEAQDAMALVDEQDLGARSLVSHEIHDDARMGESAPRMAYRCRVTPFSND